MKVSGQMHSDGFKRRLAFSFAVIIIFAFKNFLLLIIKSFITKALEYKAILKFKNNFYAFLIDESLFR